MTTPTQPTAPSTDLAAPPARQAGAGGMREVCVLAGPVVLTQISVTTMQFVDAAMVGSLGATELAAVGFGGVWLWTTMCFFIGTTSAVQTFVSQDHGADLHERCGAWTWQGIYTVVPLAAVAAGALFLTAPYLLSLLGLSAEMQPLTVQYVQARTVGSVGVATAVTISSFFRGLGDTKTPLYATVVANVVNAVLDYGLIFGELGLPRLGVLGAGIATSIAEVVYPLVLVVFFFRREIRTRYRTSIVAPSLQACRRLMRTGLPIGGQWWLEMTSFAAFSTLVARLGDTSMAASQAFVVLLSLSFMQAIGISMAVATMVGQYIGASDLPSAERSVRSGLQLGLGLAGIIAAVFILLPEPLLRIFTDDPEVIALGRPLLRIGALFQFFDAIAIVADGALRGAGDTRWPFFARFVLAWGVFLPLAYGIGVVLGGGLTGAWVGGAIYVAVLAGTLAFRFRSGAWQQIKI